MSGESPPACKVKASFSGADSSNGERSDNKSRFLYPDIARGRGEDSTSNSGSHRSEVSSSATPETIGLAGQRTDKSAAESSAENVDNAAFPEMTTKARAGPTYTDLLHELKTLGKKESEARDLQRRPHDPHDHGELRSGDKEILLPESAEEDEDGKEWPHEQRTALHPLGDSPADRPGVFSRRSQTQTSAPGSPRPTVQLFTSTPDPVSSRSALCDVVSEGDTSALSSPAAVTGDSSASNSRPSANGAVGGAATPPPKIECSADDEGGGCYCIPLRYLIVWTVFCGMVVVNAMRTNIGVTVLTILDKDTHKVNNDTGVDREVPTVDWNTQKIGYLHSIFYLGYLITHLPGGYLTTRIPSHKIFGCCILVSSVLNLTLPVAIELAGYTVTLLIRFAQGLSEGLLYPSCYGILRHWSTPQERGRVGSLVLTGAYLGPAIGFPIAGAITDYLGWDYIYYFNGGLGVLFALFWTWLSEEKPAHHSKISAGELTFIEELQGSETHDYEGLRIPWKSIMTSPAVLTLCLCNIARNWVFILMLTNEPFYLNMFKFTIAQNGAYSALPHLFKMTASLTSGLIADFVLTRRMLTTTHLRKMLTSGFGVQAFLFLMLTLTTNGTVAMVLLTCAIGFGGFVVSGWQLNHYDLSVRHASVLVAVSSTFGNVASVSVPVVTGYLTSDKTFRGWNEVFYITSFLSGLACALFLVFGSGERQPWALPSDTSCLVIKEDKRRRRPYSPAPSSTTLSTLTPAPTPTAASLSPTSAAPHFAYSTLRSETGDDSDHVTRSHVPNYGSRETTPIAVLSGGGSASDVRTVPDDVTGFLPSTR